MIGNGLHGTLLGIRGAIEGFSPLVLSYIISAYYLGVLGGSRFAPHMIKRVGHVRVFAALASMISAAFIGFVLFLDPISWFFFRLFIGFGFSGVYVVCESWLSDASTNDTRGKTLSLYVTVQMLGILLGQYLLNFGDPSTFVLFAFISILVSVSFAPILLSVAPVPSFSTTKLMSLKELYSVSPLGFISSILLGGVMSTLSGMSPVYGTELKFSVSEISAIVGASFASGMVLQYPVGWLSDRVDRRLLLISMALLCVVGIIFSQLFSSSFRTVFCLFVLCGGMSWPMYSLVIAYTNDFVGPEKFAATSGGLLFVGGISATIAPVVVGQLMSFYGPASFFITIAVLHLSIALYGIYRVGQRSNKALESTTNFTTIMPQATTVAIETAQEIAIEDQSKN